MEGWIDLFTPDGVFTDTSVGASYRGRALADPVRNYGTAFSNMHRELYRFYVDGNVVLVQLALQGTHDGPLQLPFGELHATGKHIACAEDWFTSIASEVMKPVIAFRAKYPRDWV